MSTATPQRTSAKTIFFLAATILLAITNMLLLVQNIRMKRVIAQATQRVEIQPGDIVGPLRSSDASGGEELRFGVDPRKVVLLVFSPVCRYCEVNMPKWQTLVKNIDRNSYRLIGLALKADGAKEYLQSHLPGADIPVIVNPDRNDLTKYKPSVTPQTLLIDGEGKVEKVWSGVISQNDEAALWQNLGITLE